MIHKSKTLHTMKYRLALDLGTTSIGWAILRLNNEAPPSPTAIIKAGVRIFNNGRDAKTEASLAVTRREARGMRRRRDRLLKRKDRMMRTLIEYNFFPKDTAERKALENLNPYTLRAKGLDKALTPAEFARALFHINQRRGFKSNRKTDKADNDSGALKTAISALRQTLTQTNCRTVGEFLYKRLTNEKLPYEERTVRARFRQKPIEVDGKKRIDKSYDLYIDRQMIEDEFDALWSKQALFNPAQFTEQARADLKDVLLFQRNLKPVIPGRCTLLPDEERAPLALPSVQRARMYQEVNHLRILTEGLKEQALSLAQRDALIVALEANSKRSFTQIKKLLGLGGAVQFNFEDEKRQEFKGNTTSAILSNNKHFGKAWLNLTESFQDEIVMQLIKEENETKLVRWLMAQTGVDEATAERIANVGLPEGYGSLSAKAIERLLPELRKDVVTYDKAVKAAGFDHHSHLNPSKVTGEILPELPYYGEPLQRFVGFGTNNPADVPEKRYGKIANPTVHIGLNQIRKVVNTIIERYGHPSEIIVEVARDLKQSKAQRDEEQKRQTANQKRNERIRRDIANAKFNGNEERVKHADIQKGIVWEELSFDVVDRRCPYTGVQISAEMVLSETSGVEIEHILPYKRTLDDSLNNKTISMRAANRIKGNQTPWEAFGAKQVAGFKYEEILQRAERMPKGKRYRFAPDGYEKWLKDDKDFLARALNDTRYLSRIAKEYLALICPQNTRVIPGQMTGKLRAQFGLNGILGMDGLKNRNDHRHHAVDACVIGVTDQGLLQRFANASASAKALQLDKLVENMPDPWPTYREHVKRAVRHIYVSHKPEHSYEGQMHEDTAWGLRDDGVTTRRVRNMDTGRREREYKNRSVIPFNSTRDFVRHGLDDNGQVKPYKGYVGGSNFCMDIVCNNKGKWEGEIVSTFAAYQIMRDCIKQHGKEKGEKIGLSILRSRTTSISGKPLVMRLQNGDIVKMMVNERWCLMRLCVTGSNGQMFFAEHNEANVDGRNRDKEDPFKYISKMAGSLQNTKARRVTISPIGEVNDPGLKE